VKTINLPADTEHLYLDEIAHLIADAIWPNSDVNFKSALETLKPELEQAANSGSLRVRHPQTLGLLPPVVLPDDYIDRALHVSNSFPMQYAVVLVPDFAAFVANRGITVVVEAPEQTPQPQPASAQNTVTPAPEVTETTEQRRARWLDWYGKGERGAVQRVYERELQLNPKADRSFIGKEIDKAKKEKAEIKRGGAMFGQLVQDGKRKG
jgi:hypothetical protein